MAEHLVDVHVGRGAGAALEHVDRELIVQLAVDDLLRRGHDGVAAFTGQRAERVVGQRRRLLHHGQRADQLRVMRDRHAARSGSSRRRGRSARPSRLRPGRRSRPGCRVRYGRRRRGRSWRCLAVAALWVLLPAAGSAGALSARPNAALRSAEVGACLVAGLTNLKVLVEIPTCGPPCCFGNGGCSERGALLSS